MMSNGLQAIAVEFQRIEGLRHRRSKERDKEEGIIQAHTCFAM